MTLQWAWCLLLLATIDRGLATIDIEAEAIKEAAMNVDDYYQFRDTAGRQMTSAGTMFGPKRLENSYTALYLFTRYNEMPKITNAIERSAEIAVKATKGVLLRGGVPNDVTFQMKMKPFCAVPKIKCDPFYPFRTIDGSCNNLKYPLRGKAMTPKNRLVPAVYGDKFNLGFTPRIHSVVGGPLPNPRLISNVFYTSGFSYPLSKKTNVLYNSIGQFISHDMSSVPTIRGNPDIECCKGNKPVIRPECFSFEVPKGEFQTTCMSFVRSAAAPMGKCAPGPRSQVNQVSSYIDLSVVYGTNDRTANKITDLSTGLLLTNPKHRCMLAQDAPSECLGKAPCLRAGDVRSLSTPDFIVVQTLFHLEHNRIANLLRKINPQWKPERLYQEAKRINTAVYQHIVYNEYIPLTIGVKRAKMFGLLPTFKGYSRYNPMVDASIWHGFSVGAMRFGHSQIHDSIGSANKDRSIRAKTDLGREYFNTRTIHDEKKFGADGIARWMTVEPNGRMDRYIADIMRNRLFETKPGNGFDLSALDIQRGRDHGMGTYNMFRKFCGLQPALVMKGGIFGLPDHDPMAAKLLSKLYKHPDDIDLITGGMSEMRGPDGVVGPTFACLIGLQFKESKYGDRFFYENDLKTGFNPVQLDIIKQQTMSSVLCRNFKMGSMQPWAFISALVSEPQIPCGKLPQLGLHELSAWKEIVPEIVPEVGPEVVVVTKY